jgi:hypothetical protein
MIHFFNPGHETAVLNASKYFQPAANQVKMQQELAFLPLWYARKGDFVWIETQTSKTFLNEIKILNPAAQLISIDDLSCGKKYLLHQEIDLWGISPHAIYRWEKLNRFYQMDWKIPEWKEEYQKLGSRRTNLSILSCLIDKYSEIEKEIIPLYFSQIDEIENYICRAQERKLVKSPYSSSGRGLVWLPPGKLNRSEKQIISGMLRKQSHVSIEKVLDKQLDFSMQFEIDREGEPHFAGYSVFQTNSKGAYEKSLLANRSVLEKQLAVYLNCSLLDRIKNEFIAILKEIYTPYYKGNIGVDMMVYLSGNQYRLHPCVEINMRKSMGYLAVQFQKNYLYNSSQGTFSVDYSSQPGEIWKKHSEWKKRYPLLVDNHLIKSGYFSLCPVTPTSRYHAYCIISSAN